MEAQFYEIMEIWNRFWVGLNYICSDFGCSFQMLLLFLICSCNNHNPQSCLILFFVFPMFSQNLKMLTYHWVYFPRATTFHLITHLIDSFAFSLSQAHVLALIGNCFLYMCFWKISCLIFFLCWSHQRYNIPWEVKCRQAHWF